jgi:hypothetical protein
VIVAEQRQKLKREQEKIEKGKWTQEFLNIGE